MIEDQNLENVEVYHLFKFFSNESSMNSISLWNYIILQKPTNTVLNSD